MTFLTKSRLYCKYNSDLLMIPDIHYSLAPCEKKVLRADSRMSETY